MKIVAASLMKQIGNIWACLARKDVFQRLTVTHILQKRSLQKYTYKISFRLMLGYHNFIVNILNKLYCEYYKKFIFKINIEHSLLP